MFITARERIVLTILLDNEQGLLARELAKAASVSVRTIQRDLRSLDRLLSSYDLTLLRAPLLTLKGTEAAKRHLRLDIAEQRHQDFTSEERISLLIAQLLDSKEPIKLYTLARELNVTSATVGADLKKAEEWLHSFGIELIRKRGYGIEVHGTETAIRRAMSSILSEHLTEETFYQAVYSGEMEKEVANRLLHFVDFQTIRLVQLTLAKLKQDKFPQITDQSYIALVVHVTLAIERIKKGEQIQMDQDQLHVLELEEILPVAQSVAHALEAQFAITIPREEVGYLIMHLRGARTLNPFGEKAGNAELTFRLRNLISGMEQQLEVRFNEPSFFQGLLAHLTPALYRVNQEMKIYNPLLERIQLEYPSLFAATKKQANIAFAPIVLPDEEIGFLTLHFGAVLTRQSSPASLSALVVCSSGIGSAKMLSSRIKQEFAEVTSITIASLFELDQYDPETFDLFISTVNFDKSKGAIHVSPVLTQAEVTLIRSFIESQSKNHKSMTAPTLIREHDERVAFHEITAMSRFIQALLESVIEIKSTNLQEGVLEVCGLLEASGAITHAEHVYHALLAREKLGGLAIPGAELALYHTRTSDVMRPIFTVVSLTNKTTVASMASGEEEISRVLVMLAPVDLSEDKLEFMSFLSILLIESEEQTNLFKSGSIETIQQVLDQRCREFLAAYISKGVEAE
ncbi:mannitol operon activator, BglG family [Bacillus sp. JCM 19046]|nr:mannitol operon activator, BglG family [Bacillus sp. JCM 19045]GAF19193.1 mannitol operon activator, BglG family [Bacillus sp. JCM 19046]